MDPAKQNEQRIDAELFRHLLDNSAIPLVGSAIGGVLVAISQFDSPHRVLVMEWLALLFMTVALRSWLVQRYRKRLAKHGLVPAEARRHALSTAISGLIWGCVALLVPDSPPAGIVVIITAIQAMVMGGALTLGAYLPAFRAFALPAMAPLVAILAIQGGRADLVLATYSAIFLVLVDGIARRLNNSLRHTWQLTFDKEDLVEALKQAHDLQSDLARTDSLTGIANRRQFDDVLEREFSRLKRSGAPLSILMLDVDHFKAFNDAHGHIEGDKCLIRVAEVFRKNVSRSSDLAARFGGEEFAALLPETANPGALRLAEQICSEVSAQHILHPDSPTDDHVTVSLGIVTLNCSQVASPTAAMALADRELYRAKGEGRNRVASSNYFEHPLRATLTS